MVLGGHSRTNLLTRSWNLYWEEAITATLNARMIGRPALYEKEYLDSFYSSVKEKSPTAIEDSEMAIFFEKRGYRQGISFSRAVSYRVVPEELFSNLKKFYSYGKGYRFICKRYPERKKRVLKHIFWVQPILRGLPIVRRGNFEYIFFIIAQFFGVMLGLDRKSTRLNSSHEWISRMPSSA